MPERFQIILKLIIYKFIFTLFLFYYALLVLFLFHVNRLRAKEMNATEKWANELTKQAAGKHHIGDFLPPEELRK